MKKLLLFLITLISICLPPQATAQSTRNIVLWSTRVSELSNQDASTGERAVNFAALDVTTGTCTAGWQNVTSYSTSSPNRISKPSLNTQLFGLRKQNVATDDYQYDMVTMYVEPAGSSSFSSPLKVYNYSTNYIYHLRNNTTTQGAKNLTFESLYGTISKVTLWVSKNSTGTSSEAVKHYDATETGKSGAFEAVENCEVLVLEKDAVTCEMDKTVPAENSVYEIKSIDPTRSIVLKMNGAGETTSNSFYIKRVVVTWTPTVPYAPETAPVLTKTGSDLFDWVEPTADKPYYQAKSYGFSTDNIATASTPRTTSHYWTTASATDLSKDDFSTKSSTTHTDATTKWIGAENNNDDNSAAGLKKKAIAPYVMAKANDEFGDSYDYTVRVIGANHYATKSSPETELRVTVVRPEIPEIDIDRTTDQSQSDTQGQSWDATTNTLTFTQNNPVVYFKTGEKVKDLTYGWLLGAGTLDVDNPANSTDELTSIAPVLWSEGMPPIVNGYTTWLRVLARKATVDAAGADTYYTDKYYAKGSPYVIRLTKKGDDESGVVAAPQVVVNQSGKDYSVTANGTISFISANLKVSAHSNMGTENARFEYQFSDEWSQTPDGNWIEWPEGGYEVTGTGRLFVREAVADKQSDYSSRDFRKIEIVTTDLGLVPEGQTDPVADEQAVKLAAPGGFVLMGGYNTVKIGSQDMTDTETRYVYIADAHGRAIKLVIEGGDGQQAAIIDRYLNPQYFGTHLLNDITGVIRGMENGLPELWITSDFLPFLPSLAEGTGERMEAQEADEVAFGDFNKKVVLRGMTFDPADNSFTTATGKKVKTYARLKTAPVYSTIMQLTKEVRYTVEGFVGYVGGEIMLFPTGAVKMPSLSAPNPITATDADIAAGYITVNVISDSFTVRPDKEGVREGTSCYYTFNDEEVPREPLDMTADDPVIAVTPSDFIDGVCTLSVRYVRDNINSRPVTVKFVHHDAEDVESIAAFKAMYGDDTEIPDPSVAANAGAVKYYRFKGEAEVRAITPRYLYLRDADAPADAKSAHSIMLYNANGWKAPVALRDREAAAPRELEPGDVITNFALIADRTELKNLRGYATGFSRTVQLVNADPVGDDVLKGEAWQPEEVDLLRDPTFEFSEADRMVRYRVRNVQVTRDNDNNVYKLVMGGNPELNINHVFEVDEGWGTVYDSGQHYDIEGVVLRNGEPGKFALAFIDFSIKDVTAPAAPVLALSEGADESDPTRFLTKATLTMTLPEGVDADKATIWYTTDGSDPKQSGSDRLRYEGPVELTVTTPVRAFVAVTGGLPGAVAEQVFTRTANDRRYIVNFLDQAEEGVPYHFTGNARIVAKGGEYLFVRGTQGHYLPIHVEDNAIDLADMTVGHYLSDIVMEAHIIHAGESRIVRGAHVTPQYAEAFTAPVEERPSTLVGDIELEPDVVTTLSAANARRYVKIMGVRLTGSEFTADDEFSTHDTEWKLTTEKGAGEDIPVNHTILQPSFDWDAADQTAAAYYNITGFAMLDENGRIELWPLSVEKVKSSEPVRASFAGNITVDPVTADGLTTVEFYPSTMVTLSCPIADPSSATIYYYVSHDGSRPGSNARWNVYAQPFAVTSDSYITMYATAPGYEQSAPTYVDMKLGAPAGTVAFDVKAEPGVTTVTMTAAEGAEIYWTADDTKPQAQWIRYDAPVEFTSDARIQAYAKEGKKVGAVSSMYVMVAEVLPSDIETTGNSLQFSQTVTEEGYVEVTISAASPVPGGTIYYTTEAGKKLPGEGVKYEGPIVMTESGVIIAVMVIEGRPASQIYETSVWVVPVVTGIEGIDSDRQEGVRVDGNDIVAPEGSEVYDIAGRRVRPTGLASGIYIVRTPDGKAVKVRI